MKNRDRPLNGKKIMVTRPVHQAASLVKLFSEQGGECIVLPVIQIEQCDISAAMKEVLSALEVIDFAIFISPNAVEFGFQQLLARGEIPDTLKLVTIGQASAEKVRQKIGRLPDIYPTEQYNSEALLALDAMQSDAINQKKVVIFRGRGGRELLAETLRERGARVNYIEVYQRIKPMLNDQQVDILRSEGMPDIVTLTSNEGLNNLVSMFDTQPDNHLKQCLKNLPLVVVTEKMRSNALDLGFNNTILVAEKASNEALLKSVLCWVQ
jgi:uroporphyrinogen-III synthase